MNVALKLLNKVKSIFKEIRYRVIFFTLSIPQTNGSKLVIHPFPTIYEVGDNYPSKTPWQKALVWDWYYYWPNDEDLMGYSEDHNIAILIPFTKRERI